MCTENFVKFGHVIFEICEWTDRHRDRLIALLCTPTRDKVKCDVQSGVYVSWLVGV